MEKKAVFFRGSCMYACKYNMNVLLFYDMISFALIAVSSMYLIKKLTQCRTFENVLRSYQEMRSRETHHPKSSSQQKLSV